MKFNKWTLGLAAVGAISLVPAARADEKISALGTALSNTTISGYVSASMNLAISPGGGQQFGDTSASGTGSPSSLIPFQGASKQDGINLDVVKISISKPEDESPWASGYQVDLLFGPDAVGYNTSVNAFEESSSFSSDFAIKQAFITLRTPIGNGVDWKIGVFDTPIGYEVFDAGSNPNYTRSYGYNVEPTEHTGILATYKINDQWSFSAGVANTLTAGINARDMESGAFNGAGSDWKKTAIGSVTYTAPMSWGWAAGSSIYAGVVYGFNTGSGHFGEQSGYQQNYYLGATLNTPWKQLTTGFAFDYVRNAGGGLSDPFFFFGDGQFEREMTDTYVLGAYATYKASDKLSFNGRAEYIHGDTSVSEAFLNGADVLTTDNFDVNTDGFEITATVEYDLWANVVSRVELRYDHSNAHNVVNPIFGGEEFNTVAGGFAHQDSLGLYANVIYKF